MKTLPETKALEQQVLWEERRYTVLGLYRLNPNFPLVCTCNWTCIGGGCSSMPVKSSFWSVFATWGWLPEPTSIAFFSFSMVVNLSLLCFLVWEERSCFTLSLVLSLHNTRRGSRLGSSCLLHTNRDFLKTDILFCQRRKWSLRRIQSGKKKSSGRANMPSALRIHVLKEVSDNIGQV